jgi:hypothetical protein
MRSLLLDFQSVVVVWWSWAQDSLTICDKQTKYDHFDLIHVLFFRVIKFVYRSKLSKLRL